MEFRILGPLEVIDGDRVVPLPGGRARALLALLILNSRQVVSAGRLIDELWGATPPPTANKSLQNLISHLRTRLGSGRAGGERSGVLETSDPGYLLRIYPHQVDANRFRGLLHEAAGGPAKARAVQLRAALELWRGPALADFTYEPFAQTEIAVLDELRVRAIEERVDADLALGRHAMLVGELKGLLVEHPLRERLRAQLMLALYRCGRQADALEVYRESRQALIEGLGIEPGRALSGLERAILRQDPSLEVSAEGAMEAFSVEQRMGAESWLDAERKTVTVVYIDLAESTPAGGGTDAEVDRRLLARCIDAVNEVIDHHGGTVEGFIGGVLVAVFGIPTAHEDEALRAASAAFELQEAVAELNGESEPALSIRLATRVGINTGEVVVGQSAAGPTVASGDTVKLAARLQQSAGEDEVLVSDTTRQLLGAAAQVESVATLVLDRRGRPATAWRLVGLTPGAPVRAPGRDRPLVGRRAELARLHAAFQRVVRQQRAALLTVIGEGGVGKSRLALEFTETLASGIRVLVGSCPAYGDGITFWPLREIVAEAAGDGGRDGIAALLAEREGAESIATRIAGAIGLDGEPVAGSELFPDMRCLFETLACKQPLVVVVDDIHWAQPTFLDLVSYVGDTVRAPLLIVCLARPELLDERRTRLEGRSASLVLEPLSPSDSEKLVTHRLAGRIVPDELVGKVVEMAQGNPLFIEQLLASLRDHAELPLPPSLQALLAARLDRLGPAEHDLLRCASVVGVEFSSEALSALVPVEAGPFVQRHLQVLERKELVNRSRRTFVGSPAHCFRHVLIQVAAYRSITRQDRADLHERFAGWLDSRGAESPPELNELVGYHLEQAHAQRRQLGIADDATQDLAVRAGERLMQAGLRAYHQFDMTAAENLLSRARALLPADHPKRYEVLRRLSEAYPTLGRIDDAEAVVAEMLCDPRVHEDARLEQRLRLEQLRIRLIAGPDPMGHDTIRTEVTRALDVLEPLEDHIGMSQACYLLATMCLRSGEVRELSEVGRRGLDHARRSGDVREELGALWWPAWALVAGPTPVPDAIRSCEELMRVSRGQHPAVMTDLARLQAMVGEFDVARELVARARRHLVERIRVRRALTVIAQRSAEVEILAGDLDAAERTLRSSLDIALDVGERDQTAQIAAQLSRVLSARGNVEDAETFASLSRQQSPAESVAAQALWRTATARALAVRRDAEARRLAQEAIALVPGDMLNLRADLYLDLAQILVAADQHQAATSATREAADLYERKGNLVGARGAVRLGGEFAASPP